MKMFKYILLMLIIVWSSKQANKSDQKTCDQKSENQMDIALARLLVLGQKGVKFPETVEQLRPFCNQVNRLFVRIQRYVGTCLNNFGKDTAKVIVHSIKNEFNSICKPGRLNKRALTLLESAPCGNQGKMKFYKECYVPLVDKFMGALNAKIDKRIPISCCNFHEFLRCWETTAESIPKCTPKLVDFFIKWLTKIFEGVTQLMCVLYDESNAQCETIIQESPNRTASQKRYKSVLLPLINIGLSLGEEIPKPVKP